MTWLTSWFLSACFYNQKKWQSNITLFIMAQTISLLGSSLVQFALIWYVTLSTASGKMLAISTVCAFMPQILISPLAGVFIDRYDRKKIIMGADIIIAVATLILAMAFKMDVQNIALLFIVLAVRSIGTGIQTPAVNSVIPQMVPRSFLMRINGIQSTLNSLILFFSPSIKRIDFICYNR